MSEVAGGPGAIVWSQRESLGLTRQDVADSLNLSVRVVEAIETEAWDQLPNAAFVRGYLRAYAKLLDLDGEALAHAYETSADVTGTLRPLESIEAVDGRSGVADLLQRHPGAVLSGAVAAVIGVVAVVLMAVWPQTPQSANAAAAPTDVATPRASGLVLSSVAPPSALPSSTTVVDPPRAVHAALGADASGARRITATGDDHLTFAFAADSWVEVKDAHGAPLYSNLGKAGDTLELVGHPPFHIRLGNAPGVTLSYNDERVTLTPHTRNNVGTLVLGQ